MAARQPESFKQVPVLEKKALIVVKEGGETSPDDSGVFQRLNSERRIKLETKGVQDRIQQALEIGVKPQEIENEPHEFIGFTD